MTSSKPTKHFIYHKPALAWIKKLEASKSALIKKSGIFQSDLPIELDRSLKSFQFSFDYSNQFDLHGTLDLGPYREDLHLSIEEQEYIATRVFLGTHSPPSFSGSIDRFHTKGYSETNENFYRMIIPLERELSFHYQLQEYFFDTDLGYTSRTGSKCTIKNDDLILAVFHDDDKNYFLSIESKLAQDFGSFSEKAFAARNALAYVSGYYAGDSCYCFTFPTKEMKEPEHLHFLSIRSTMRSHYEPINTNPYSRLYYDRPVAEKWYEAKCLRPLSIQEFSRLGELIHTNQDFASAIVLILESSVASLLFMPGGYAIALETLAPLVFKEKKRSLNSISDKNLWKDIRLEILAVIDKFRESHPEHDYDLLSNKVDGLNRTSNRNILKAPFGFLDIQLLDADEIIIETRNQFLHGTAPDLTGAGEGRTTDRLNSDLYYSALRLSTLLSMLILKWVGYDNYVLNYPKINEVSTGIPLDEEPYRKV